MGFICMKAISGGLITNAKAAAAFILQFDNALPIWGIQKEEELDQWLSLFDETPEMDEEIRAVIAKDREELAGDHDLARLLHVGGDLVADRDGEVVGLELEHAVVGLDVDAREQRDGRVAAHPLAHDRKSGCKRALAD